MIKPVALKGGVLGGSINIAAVPDAPNATINVAKPANLYWSKAIKYRLTMGKVIIEQGTGNYELRITNYELRIGNWEY